MRLVVRIYDSASVEVGVTRNFFDLVLFSPPEVKSVYRTEVGKFVKNLHSKIVVVCVLNAQIDVFHIVYANADGDGSHTVS